jgi:endonuclease/exonuclease/phosphatase (EEP) superfamily protein YafD
VLFWLVVAVIAAPALPLTLNRLVDADVGAAVRMMSFTSFATPFYLLAALLVGGALVLGRAGPRRVVAPVLAVLVLGLGLHVWWLAPLYVGDNPAPAQGATPITVMTFNMYEGRADPTQLFETLRDEDVDVVVLPEITFGTLHALEEMGLDEEYPYHLGRPNGAVDGTMVFSRLVLTDTEVLPAEFQSYRVTLGEGDDAFVLLAVHPRAPVPPGGAPQWSAENATMLAGAKASDADLVLGDFNATSDHAPMRAWKDAGWRDSLELVNAGWSRTWPANGISPVPDFHPPALIQIDHVLVGDRLAAIDSEVVEIEGSDHRAVIATVARR